MFSISQIYGGVGGSCVWFSPKILSVILNQEIDLKSHCSPFYTVFMFENANLTKCSAKKLIFGQKPPIGIRPLVHIW